MIVESIERILRQLEAIGENLEHSSIEKLIENKLPGWILDKACRKCLKGGYIETDYKKICEMYVFIVKNHITARSVCDDRRQFNQAGHNPISERDVKLDDETAIINTITERENEILLLCKEVTVFNPENSKCCKVLVFFDIGGNSKVNVVEYLTSELHVADISSTLDVNYPLETLAFYRKKTNMLIGADYFFKFTQLEKIQ
ncbi:unnamed protein product [Dracunculus medinensis]|uniref:DUF1758 domain-containing protein n=1 Tax=Dracunculus medinensis TaxID=318479 RepID=A0A0N4UCS7_DRAME|nr:unnamed protein product [Dracunculus medinensis]